VGELARTYRLALEAQGVHPESANAETATLAGLIEAWRRNP
jgi:hypothetical protein